MEKIKVFIADNDIASSEKLRETINFEEDMEVIGVINNGKKGLYSEALSSADVLLLADILPGLDGLSLLKNLKIEARIPMVVILLTSFPTAYVKEQAIENGAQVILPKNTAINRLIQNIRDLVLAENNRSDCVWERKVRQQLEYYGIPTHLGGFKYLCEVLTVLSANENHLHKLQSSVFPAISKKYNTSTLSIERRIHYAIQVAWHHKSHTNLMKTTFGQYTPTVKTFIGFLTNVIK
jgi:two-component system, response regulator, stage 0 sporulation protein A